MARLERVLICCRRGDNFEGRGPRGTTDGMRTGAPRRGRRPTKHGGRNARRVDERGPARLGLGARRRRDGLGLDADALPIACASQNEGRDLPLLRVQGTSRSEGNCCPFALTSAVASRSTPVRESSTSSPTRRSTGPPYPSRRTRLPRTSDAGPTQLHRIQAGVPLPPAQEPAQDRVDRCLPSRQQEGCHRGGCQEALAQDGQAPAWYRRCRPLEHLGPEEPEARGPRGPEVRAVFGAGQREWHGRGLTLNCCVFAGLPLSPPARRRRRPPRPRRPSRCARPARSCLRVPSHSLPSLQAPTGPKVSAPKVQRAKGGARTGSRF